MAAAFKIGFALCLAVLLGTAQPAVAEEAPRQPTLSRSSVIVVGVESGIEAGRGIDAMVRPLGGRLMRAGDLDASVEVPSARYRDFVAELSRMAELRSEKVTTTDTSALLADAMAEVQAARAARQRREKLAGVARDVNEKLTVERVLEGSSSRIVSAEARVRELESRAAVVWVEIRFQTEGKESIEPATLPFPWLDELGPARLANPPDHVPSRSLELRALTDFALSLKTSYVHDAAPLDGTQLAMALAFDMRVLGEANPVGLFGGMNVALGASQGFVYGLQFMGGVGMPIGRRFAFGVSSGPGIDGLTTVVPFGLVFPVELWLGWDLFEWLNVSAWGHNAWVVGSDDRQSGSAHALFGDELSVGLALVLADRDSFSSYTQRRHGWLFGAGYRELLGTEMFELRLGYAGIDADFSGSY
ncbi:MAG: DUF4349 domain-containing protein [Myxococcales bacterium]|nr:DUF4349 domain-containing protein [Myxococcales bacterium]